MFSRKESQKVKKILLHNLRLEKKHVVNVTAGERKVNFALPTGYWLLYHNAVMHHFCPPSTVFKFFIVHHTLFCLTSVSCHCHFTATRRVHTGEGGGGVDSRLPGYGKRKCTVQSSHTYCHPVSTVCFSQE